MVFRMRIMPAVTRYRSWRFGSRSRSRWIDANARHRRGAISSKNAIRHDISQASFGRVLTFQFCSSLINGAVKPIHVPLSREDLRHHE
jgi:hypothetical protein